MIDWVRRKLSLVVMMIATVITVIAIVIHPDFSVRQMYDALRKIERGEFDDE